MLTYSCKKDDINNSNDQTPELTTSGISNITYNSAVSGGNVTSEGLSTVTERGICWSRSQSPTITNSRTNVGPGTGKFISTLTDLTSSTTFYVRAYATNSFGTSYGSEKSFTTNVNPIGTIADIDGNVYHTVVIGTQVWMVENLKTTRYRDGTSIPNVTDKSVWKNLLTGGYCDYNNVPSNSNIYGRLYNWYAINNSRKITPLGWHVPTEVEWNTLITFLGGKAIAGGKLKEIGTLHWKSPNGGATNEVGFTGLPGGVRGDGGTFQKMGELGIWICATEHNVDEICNRYLYFEDGRLDGGFTDLGLGFSIRCIKD